MKIRRHLPKAIPWARLFSVRGPRKDLAIAIWVLVGGLVLGYAAAAMIVFPAPLFVSEHGVPRLLGMDLEEAQKALDGAALTLRRVDQVAHPAADRGLVVWQDPPPEVVVPAGTEVDLVISRGPQRVQVPDLAGHDAELARTLVTAAGLTLGPVQTAQTALPRGVVVTTRPPAGASLAPGGQVTLVVSVGAPTITVPRLLGLTLGEARAALEAAGLALGDRRTRASAAPPGTVIEQNPGPGALSAPGAAVMVTLARRGG